MPTIQYGLALECLIREVIIADPALGPVHVLKVNVSDGFYCIGLCLKNSPNLGLFFLSEGEDEELVAIMLNLLMGWKNSPPVF